MNTYGPWSTVLITRPIVPPSYIYVQTLTGQHIYVGLFEAPLGVRASHWTYWLMTEGGGVRVGIYGVQGSTAQLVAQIAGPGAPQPLVTVNQDILLAPGLYAVALAGDATGSPPSVTTWHTNMMDGANLYPMVGFPVEGRIGYTTWRLPNGSPLPETINLKQLEPWRDATLYLKLWGE